MIESVPTRISHPTPKLDQNIMLFVRLLRADRPKAWIGKHA